MSWTSSTPKLAAPSAGASLPGRSSEAAPGSAVHHLSILAELTASLRAHLA